eukprot:scaffold128_cov248-Pinguiococcus_pyrenoidosus.AAC.26
MRLKMMRPNTRMKMRQMRYSALRKDLAPGCAVKLVLALLPLCFTDTFGQQQQEQQISLSGSGSQSKRLDDQSRGLAERVAKRKEGALQPRGGGNAAFEAESQPGRVQYLGNQPKLRQREECRSASSWRLPGEAASVEVLSGLWPNCKQGQPVSPLEYPPYHLERRSQVPARAAQVAMGLNHACERARV